MNHRSCETFRELVLEDVLESRSTRGSHGHSAQCEPCARWERSVRVQVEWLRSMPRRVPPEALETDLREALAAEPRCVELLRALEPRRAPLELEARVAKRLEARPDEVPASSDSLLGESIGRLAAPHLPSVLDRLVEEELSAPAAHRVERFVGNLERRTAPPELTLRVARDLRPDRSARLGPRIRRLAGAAALVAASWLLWTIDFASFTEPLDPTPVRRLRIVRVDASQGGPAIAPLAQGLAGSLSGGLTPAISSERAIEEERG